MEFVIAVVSVFIMPVVIGMIYARNTSHRPEYDNLP